MNYDLDKYPGRILKIDGKDYIYFGGTAYLGLQTHKDFQQILKTNIKRLGSNYGASRASNVKIRIFDQAESHLAVWTGSEDAMTLSSGFLAGNLVLQHFHTPEYRVFHGPNCHAAILDNRSKIHGSWKDLNEAVQNHIGSGSKEIPVLFLDSVNTSDERSITEVLSEFPMDRIILVADDSHGIGVFGEKGCGSFRDLNDLEPLELVICCSLGKALATQAGLVLGSASRISEMRKSPVYIGSSPAGPAQLASLIEAMPLVSRQWSKLIANVDLLRNALSPTCQLKKIKDHPVFSFEDPKLYAFLISKGFLPTYFSYSADQEDGMPGRIVINAWHSDRDLKDLARHLNDYYGH